MDREDDLLQQIEALRERLSRLSEASLRINESLDFDVVLQDVLDSARTLIQARYGVITLLDESGQVRNSLSSGLTSEFRWSGAEALGLKLLDYGLSGTRAVP